MLKGLLTFPITARHKCYVSSTKQEKMNINNIRICLESACGCEAECHAKLDEIIVLKWREKIWTIPLNTNRKSRILELLRENMIDDNDKKKFKVEHLVVCKKAWYKTVLGIGKRSYSRYQKAHKDRLHRFSSTPSTGVSGRRGECIGFIHNFISCITDADPSSCKVYLPRGMKVSQIFHQYKLSSRDSKKLKRTQFYDVWKTHYSKTVFTRNTVNIQIHVIKRHNKSVYIYSCKNLTALITYY